MLEQELKLSIQSLWDKFWSGGIANPLVAIEQITYLIFMRRLEVLDAQHEQHAKTKNEKFKSVFNKNENCRWSHWKNMNANDMLKHMVTVVFPFIQNLDGDEDTLYSKYMKGATFMIQKPSLLQEAVSIFDELNITNQNQDTQGDIYEFLLNELQISGKNGQFRTPRHIIRLMVDLVDPQLGQTICDPACGTGGFLINAYEHIVKSNTSHELLKIDPDGTVHNLIGDKITKKEHWNLLKNRTFFGFDFDYTMIRIGLMNMILHGINHPNISYADSLSKTFEQSKQYDIVLANPPFAGSIDKGDVNDNFSLNSTKTELLFLELFHNMLKIGGKCCVIVPDGVLSSTSSKAHKDLRQHLLEKCQLEGIISLPSGVFKPYSGVSTAILIFTKGGSTKQVWFYQMDNDGFSLDDKRNPISKNDISDIQLQFKNKKTSPKSWNIDINEIKKNDWNLSVSRYKPFTDKEIKYENPKIIFKKIIKLETEIQNDLNELEKML